MSGSDLVGPGGEFAMAPCAGVGSGVWGVPGRFGVDVALPRPLDLEWNCRVGGPPLGVVFPLACARPRWRGPSLGVLDPLRGGNPPLGVPVPPCCPDIFSEKNGLTVADAVGVRGSKGLT